MNLLLVFRNLFFKHINSCMFFFFPPKCSIYVDFMKTLKATKIRVSVIGLSAEVRVCTVLARETGGIYLESSVFIHNYYVRNNN